MKKSVHSRAAVDPLVATPSSELTLCMFGGYVRNFSRKSRGIWSKMKYQWGWGWGGQGFSTMCMEMLPKDKLPVRAPLKEHECA